MQIPDIVGERLCNALDIIKNQYPMLKYEVVFYHSPKSGNSTEVLPGIERVVRQRLVGEEKLELVVSFFKEEPCSD